LLAVILACFSAGIYIFLRQLLYDNLDDTIRNRAATFNEILLYEDGRPTLVDQPSFDDPNAGESFVRVFDTSGTVTVDNSAEAGQISVNAHAIEVALRGGTTTRTVTTNDQALRVLTVPIRQGNDVSGALEIGQSQADVSNALRSLLLVLAIAYPVTLAAASAGGAFLAGRALSPIDSLTKRAKKITAEDLSARLDSNLPDDEVGRLARTLDEMIARLDEAFRRQRQFTADASHELRSPLTTIKGQVGLARSKPRDEQAYRDVLGIVEDEADQMARIVDSLLTLARADAGHIVIVPESVDLGELIKSVTEQLRPAAERKHITVTVNAGPDVVIDGDDDLLIRLVLNLLGNAIKFTPHGGTVTVGWGAENQEATFWVHDTGVGIAPEHLNHIFDRFYRVDSARTQSEEGTGLGLSICQWIAKAHGGSVSVISEIGRGSTFAVKLAAAKATSS
jgi:heavy metal sensor kinase